MAVLYLTDVMEKNALPQFAEDVGGRLRNTRLGNSRGLQALFETIANSFDAIHESQTSDGTIRVVITREAGLDLSTDKEKTWIGGFSVIDNGVGFGSENFDAFLTADTPRKKAEGGKGVGRFLWLKVFRTVKVESVFLENGKQHKRVFTFEPTSSGITSHEVMEAPDVSRTTRVELLYMRENYRNECPTRLSDIAYRILEHCLTYLRKENGPQLIISDGEESLDIRQLYQDTVQRDAVSRTVDAKGHKLSLTYYKLMHERASGHLLHLCASGRDVKALNLSEKVPDLPKTLEDSDGNRFCYAVYVAGDLLDRLVNSERTDFRFAQEGDLDLSMVTEDALEGLLLREVEEFLQSYISSIRKDKMQRITEYIQGSAPVYRHLLTRYRDRVEKFPANLPPIKLEQELARTEFEVRQEVQKRYKNLIEERYLDPNRYQEELREFISEHNEIGKDKLADYVSHRRAILSLLEKAMQSDVSGEYKTEDVIHNLIFPMKSSSDEVNLEDQNLWVLDERLSYHKYLASDLELRQIQALDTNNRQRPDLVIFNCPIAYSEDDYPYGSVVIVEFKRPERDDYSEKRNPISQVLNYVERIRNGQAKNANGRRIPVKDERQFFCHIIADITPTLRKLLLRDDFRATVDGLGFYKYHTQYQAYCEVIPYDKLLRDAERRNRILFEKLNIL